ncbi:methyltransferase, partial [Candidatus Woesearchaeota archaeon]|nr:methyltransferase [Candidatus Woesearchaeota archaeon]
MIYEPREDSHLLLEQVKKYAKGKVIDIGTGSAIQAIAAAQKRNVKSVLAVDIQKDVIRYCRKNIKHPKISFRQSDLFSKVEGSFDTIVFNPPYLPEDLRARDITLEGGKKGYEMIERFFHEAGKHLAPDGRILMVHSSFT